MLKFQNGCRQRLRWHLSGKLMFGGTASLSWSHSAPPPKPASLHLCSLETSNWNGQKNKNSFRIFHKLVWKNPNELFGKPSISSLSLSLSHTHTHTFYMSVKHNILILSSRKTAPLCHPVIAWCRISGWFSVCSMKTKYDNSHLTICIAKREISLNNSPTDV